MMLFYPKSSLSKLPYFRRHLSIHSMITKRLILPLLVLCAFFCQSATAQQLNANFSASPTGGCVPIRVSFTDLSTGNPTAWKWDFGNGGTAVIQNPSTTYTQSGNFTIRLVVYRNNGADSSVMVKTNYIVVLPNPEVAFGATPLQGCFPLPVVFTDSSLAGSGTITNWQWDFGDGNISNQQNPTHTYLNPGIFNVTLTVRNSNGCSKTLNKQNLIGIYTGVRALFTNTNPPTCVIPVTVNFTNTATGPVASYQWLFGDGGTSSAPNPSHTYTTAGIYTVRLVVVSTNGCTDTIVKPGLIRAGIVDADFNAPLTVCAGTAFSLQNNSAPGASLAGSTWFFGDGSTSTATNPTHTYAAGGTYTIKLIADFGQCRDSISKTIMVNPKPTAAFTGNNLFACTAPLTTTFTNTSSDGISYSWSFGDGSTSTTVNPVHTYTSNGIYTVMLVVQNTNGCRDTLRRVDYVVISPPNITGINPLPAQGCVPYPVTFAPTIAAGQNITTYQWDFGDGSTGTGPNPSHTYTTEGTYTVKLKVTAATGCTDTFSFPAGVKVGNKPMTAFNATPLIACAQDPIHFTDLTSAPLPDEWFWQFGDGATSTQQNPEHHYNDTGTFTVTLIVTRNGCKDTLKKIDYIYIKPPIARFIDSFDCSNQKLHYFLDRSKGALIYNWTFGDGSTATIPSPIHTYADTGHYTVKLRVSNGTCQHEATANVLVLNEKANFNITDSLACKSTSKKFLAFANPLNLRNYSWDFGEGFGAINTTEPAIVHSYNSLGQFNVKLTITDLNNCTDTLTKPVIVVQNGPRADFSSYQKVCVRNLTTFTDSSKADASNPIVQWIWNYGDTTGWHTYTAPPFTHAYTTGGLYNITLVTVDAAGCRDSLIKQGNVQINDPKANFASDDTTICLNSPATITDMSQGNIVLRAWDLGDGTTAATANVTHPYTAEGSYTIRLKVTDEANCTDSIVKPLYINVFNAKARFNMSDSFTTCPPLFVTFTNQSINARHSEWDFGDANTSNLQTPSHTYTISGTFTVQLAIEGNGGCRDTTTKRITILGPTGTFTYGPLIGCAPLSVNFAATAQNTVKYTFDFTDGNTQYSAATTASHPYLIPGDYIPKVILEDSFGCKLPLIGPDTIRVKGVKTYIKQLPSYLICDSAIIQFRDSTIANDVISSFQWNFGDGTTSFVRNPAHVYRTPGLYTVTLKVTTTTGCFSMDTLRVPIRVSISPKVGITGLLEGCVPTIVQFTGQWLNPDTSTVSWNWNFNNGQTALQQNPTAIPYNTPGNYTVTLIARNASGCYDTVTHPLTVWALPNIDAGPDKFVCRGQSATITATGGTTYVWTAHPSLSCTSCTSPAARPDSTRFYYVKGTDSHTCQNTDSVLVRVKQPFKMRVAPGDTLCFGQSFQLQGFGAENYLWTPSRYLSSTTIANPVSRPDSSITYRLVGYDSVGCFKDTGYVTIKVYPIPKIDIIENQITINAGDPVQFHSTASADVTRWRWIPQQNLTCIDCPNPIANPRQSMVYTLTVSNDGRCTATDRVNISLLCKDGNVFVPNTFSPNNDGANDVFYPRGKGLFSVKSMRIFNRWGELLFEKTNFQANDPNFGWNGTQNGTPLTPDVYVYIMEILCDNSVIYNVKGNVTLLK